MGAVRPKKRVLIFSAEELGAMPMRFVIETRGYFPMLAHTIDEYAAALEQLSPDVVLILHRGTAVDQAIRAAQLADRRGLNVLVALMAKAKPWEGLAHAVVQERSVGFVAELVHQLHVFSARRRGPKKADSLNAMRMVAAAHTAAAGSERALA
jgi:hypothetical protein